MILVCNQCHSFGTFIQEIVVNKFAEISLPCAIAEAVLNLNDSVENYSGSYLPGLRYCSMIVSLGTALFWRTIKIEKPKGFIKDTTYGPPNPLRLIVMRVKLHVLRRLAIDHLQ